MEDIVTLDVLANEILNGLSNAQNELQFVSRENDSGSVISKDDFFELELRKKLKNYLYLLRSTTRKEAAFPQRLICQLA